jgi:signal transduction histidine kinase
MRFSWQNLSLQSKFMIGLAAAAGAACLFFGLSFYFHMKGLLESEVADKGDLALAQVEAVQEYVRETLRPAMYDTLEGDRFVIEAMSTSYVSRNVMENISMDVQNFVYRRVALNARNPEFEPNEHEMELLRLFRDHPGRDAWRGMRSFGGEEYHVTAHPVLFKQSCMRCHGDPAEAPEELIERYGDERGFGHTAGEIAGVTSVRIPVQAALDSIRETAVGFLMLAGIAGLLCFAMANVLFNRLVVHSLRGLADVFPRYFRDTEPGMLDKLRRGDEIDEIFNTVEEMAEHLSRAREELEDYAQNLERMVGDRTKDLARAARDHSSDVQLFVGMLSSMTRSHSRRELMGAVLPQIVERFGLKEAAFVCTFASNTFYSWPSGRAPELPDYAMEAVTGDEPVFEKNRAFVPVQSSDSSVEGLLCLYRGQGAEAMPKRAEVIVALARQLGIAMENLSFMDRLMSQNDLLESLFEGISDPLMLVDSSCNLLLANRAARELIEGKPGPEGGPTCIEHVLGGIAPDRSEHKGRVIARDRAAAYELRLLDDRYYRVHVYPLPEAEKDGRRRFVVYARDNSAEKRMLQSIQQNEKMVTVGKLAAGLAHEMNNPLGVILCYAELLRSSANSGQEAQDVEVIIQHTKKAQKVLQDLLNFARTKKAASEGLSDPAGVLKGLVEMFSVQAESKDIELAADVPEALPQVRADGSSLEQVFGNLLINAMDAVEPGKGKVLVSAAQEDGRVRISVKDNGPGVAEEHMSRIFDPFFTTKDVGKGTGLGLAVVYGIVEELGGSVQVENGDGAEFVLYMPIAERAEGAAADE